jgi:hypothetical protein
MGTWVATIVQTTARTDFWELVRGNRVEPITSRVPAFALIDCGAQFGASYRLAETLSRDLMVMTIGFVAQTNADVHELRAFERGTLIRRLAYLRHEGGWVSSEGAKQPWESAYFFDGKVLGGAPDGAWPDMLDDELSDDDLARYNDARDAGDASSILELLHPSSMAPLRRLCSHFQIEPDRPAGRLMPRSFWSRMFG